MIFIILKKLFLPSPIGKLFKDSENAFHFPIQYHVRWENGVTLRRFYNSWYTANTSKNIITNGFPLNLICCTFMNLKAHWFFKRFYLNKMFIEFNIPQLPLLVYNISKSNLQCSTAVQMWRCYCHRSAYPSKGSTLSQSGSSRRGQRSMMQNWPRPLSLSSPPSSFESVSITIEWNWYNFININNVCKSPDFRHNAALCWFGRCWTWRWPLGFCTVLASTTDSS